MCDMYTKVSVSKQYADSAALNKTRQILRYLIWDEHPADGDN